LTGGNPTGVPQTFEEVLLKADVHDTTFGTDFATEMFVDLTFANHVAVTTRRLVMTIKCTRGTENRPEFGKRNYAEQCERNPREKV